MVSFPRSHPAAVPPTRYAVQHFHHDTLDSTNLEARRLWIHSRASPSPPHVAPRPFAVTAATQTAGLGRTGRSWQSPPGGLWLTVAWPAAQPLPHYQALSLVVGLAAVRTLIDLTRLDCQIKWPNDILLADRKLAGILCQAEPGAMSPGATAVSNGRANVRPGATASRVSPGATAVSNGRANTPHAAGSFLLLGIGINANFPASALARPGDLRLSPTTLRDALGHDIDLPTLTPRLLDQLESTLIAFDEPVPEPLAPFLPELRNRLAWRGHPVSITDSTSSTPPITGTLLDLTSTGELLLQTPTGPQTITSGDLSLTRAPSNAAPRANS